MLSHIFTVAEASVANGDTFLQVAALVAERHQETGYPLSVVVVPAMSGMNHMLFEMIRHAFAGRPDSWRVVRAAFYDKHQQVLATLPEVEKKNALCQQVAAVFHDLDQELIAFPKEADQRMLDASARIASCGER